MVMQFKPVTPNNLPVDPAPRTPSTKIRSITLPKELKPLTQENVGAWAYLKDRGLTDQEIADCGTLYTDQEVKLYNSRNVCVGSLKDRVVWPVYGGDNQTVSYLARIVDPGYTGFQKYLNCPESDLSKTLWPYVPPGKGKVILVEGLLDSLAFRRISGLYSYSCFGKHITKEQIEILQSWGVREVILAWDKRDAKKEMASAVKKSLSLAFSKVYVPRQKNWPKGLDAGDMLRRPDGEAMISNLANDVIDCSSLDFQQWLIEE
jgi:DNA primase